MPLLQAIMKWFIMPVIAAMIAAGSMALGAGGFDLRVTSSGGGQVQVLATNIPGGIRGYCVWESSSNLVNWKPVVTNFVNKDWSTNTFTGTGSVCFYRAWVY